VDDRRVGPLAQGGLFALTLETVEDHGVQRLLDELAVDLRAGTYRPAPVRRGEIPLNLFLRVWGNYFRTGNAAKKFRQLDRHVTWRLKRLLIKKRGGDLRVGQAGLWTRAWFHDQGLHQLMGTARYPKVE